MGSGNELSESSLTILAEENSRNIHEFFLASKNEIEKVKQRKKRLTISLVTLFSLSLIGFVFVLLWLNSKSLQAEIANTAKANAIATKAYTLLEHDPTLAFRLAEESYKIDPTPLNKQVIMAAYAKVPFYEKLEGHTNWVVYAEYSKDGNCIATARNDNFGKLWDKKGKLIAILEGHKAPLPYGSKSIIFSNNSKFILTCSRDSTARLWNFTGKCLAILKHNGPVNSVCFSPDDKKILTASSDRTARVWDLNGKEIVKLEHEKVVTKALFSKDNFYVFSIDGDKIKMWDINGKLKREFKGHHKPIRDFSISKNGKYLVTASSDTIAILWDIEHHKIIQKFIGHSDYVRWAIFSKNDSLVLTASKDNTARLWDLHGKEKAVLRGHSAFIWSIGFSPDGAKIATASDDGTARLWNLEGHEIMLLKGHTSQVFSAQFSPDGKQIVTGSGDKTARIWTIEPEENPILIGHTGYVVDANFSPDGKNIVTAGYDYSAKLWDRKGKLISNMQHTLAYGIDLAGFDYNGNIYTLNNTGEGVIFWNPKGKPIDTLKIKKSIKQTGFDFSPTCLLINSGNNILYLFHKTRCFDTINSVVSGRFIKNKIDWFFTIGLDSTLCFWKNSSLTSMPDFKQIVSIAVPKTNLASAEFSINGKYMVTTSEDSIIRIWDMEEIFSMKKNQTDTSVIKIGSEKMKLQIKPNAMVSSITFSPRENIFISNSEENILRLWNIEGNQMAEFIGHSDVITDLNFSPDGKSIVSSSADKSVRLWDLNGDELMVFTGHESQVYKAKFSPDGNYILSASFDHTARLMPISVNIVLNKINKEKVRGDVYKLSEQELKVYGVK